MKILLIDPPFKRFTGFVSFYFPIGLAYLAAVVRDAGYEVSVFDVDAVEKGTDIDFSQEYKRLEIYRQGLNNDTHEVWRGISKELSDFKPDIVGITAMTPKFGTALKTAQVVRKTVPQCKVIIGGPHATLLPNQTLKSKDIDIIVRGEGEDTFLELIQVIENKGDLSTIKGVSFVQGDKIFHNPERNFIENLDKVPFPARDLLMYAKNYTSEDMGVIMTSRGCPFNCSYCCHMWQRKIRNRSLDNIIKEIKQVKKQFGTYQFEFKDDSFTLDKRRIGQLCQKMIEEKIDINWSCTTRVDLLDEEIVKKMKKSGCNVIKLGIETGSERVLKETKKGVTFRQMKETAQLLNRHKIFWSGYFMAGLPTETEDDIKKTFNFMKELNPYYAGLGVYNPFPKTDLFEQGVKMGLLYPDVGLDHFFTTNPKDYFFVDPSRRVANIEKEKFDELVAMLMKEFHVHNTQLKNILRRGWARRMVYLKDLKLMLKDIRKVLKWCLGK